MAERIKVSVDVMRGTVSKYNTQKGVQINAFNRMNMIVKGLQSVWTGEAARTFQQQYNSFHANIRQSEAKMQDAVDELNHSAGLYTAAENESKSISASQDVGRSPF